MAAFKSQHEIELKNIKEVKPETNTWFRCPGTFLPRFFCAGTYYRKKGKEFWYYRKGKQYITLKLQNDKYKRVVLGVNNNRYWSELLKTAIRLI